VVAQRVIHAMASMKNADGKTSVLRVVRAKDCAVIMSMAPNSRNRHTRILQMLPHLQRKAARDECRPFRDSCAGCAMTSPQNQIARTFGYKTAPLCR